jgi:hypothetical protein
MVSRKVLFASGLIAPALLVSTPAFAGNTFAGSGASFISNGNGAFLDTAIPVGTFNDEIEFSVPTEGMADVGVLYFKFVTGLSNVTATFNGAPITFTQVAGDLYSGGIQASVLPGLQKIAISGTSNGISASYSGNVKFAAVPEVATWLMMIAGIGFAGLALRRRRPDYTATYAF